MNPGNDKVSGIFLFLLQTKKRTMRLKLLAAALLAVTVYNCAPKVSVTAMKPDPVQVPPKIASPEEGKTEAHAEGKSLYGMHCAKCHELFHPTDFTKAQWGPIMTRMQPKAQIDDEQAALIYNYITDGLN